MDRAVEPGKSERAGGVAGNLDSSALIGLRKGQIKDLMQNPEYATNLREHLFGFEDLMPKEGWIGVFKSILDGTIDNSRLSDLQAIAVRLRSSFMSHAEHSYGKRRLQVKDPSQFSNLKGKFSAQKTYVKNAAFSVDREAEGQKIVAGALDFIKEHTFRAAELLPITEDLKQQMKGMHLLYWALAHEHNTFEPHEISLFVIRGMRTFGAIYEEHCLRRNVLCSPEAKNAFSFCVACELFKDLADKHGDQMLQVLLIDSLIKIGNPLDETFCALNQMVQKDTQINQFLYTGDAGLLYAIKHMFRRPLEGDGKENTEGLGNGMGFKHTFDLREKKGMPLGSRYHTINATEPSIRTGEDINILGFVEHFARFLPPITLEEGSLDVGKKEAQTQFAMTAILSSLGKRIVCEDESLKDFSVDALIKRQGTQLSGKHPDRNVLLDVLMMPEIMFEYIYFDSRVAKVDRMDGGFSYRQYPRLYNEDFGRDTKKKPAMRRDFFLAAQDWLKERIRDFGLEKDFELHRELAKKRVALKKTTLEHLQLLSKEGQFDEKLAKEAVRKGDVESKVSDILFENSRKVKRKEWTAEMIRESDVRIAESKEKVLAALDDYEYYNNFVDSAGREKLYQLFSKFVPWFTGVTESRFEKKATRYEKIARLASDEVASGALIDPSGLAIAVKVAAIGDARFGLRMAEKVDLAYQSGEEPKLQVPLDFIKSMQDLEVYSLVPGEKTTNYKRYLAKLQAAVRRI